LDYPDNTRILDVAACTELMTMDESELLKQHYLYLRRLINRQSLEQKPSIVERSDTLASSCEQIKVAWNRLLITPFVA